MTVQIGNWRRKKTGWRQQ